MTLARIWHGSPNYSSRGGAAVRLVVVHTAQGARTAAELSAYFANPSSGVSSHVAIDDTPSTVWECVRPDQKSWTQGNANPVSVSAEMCAWAEWSRSEWAAHSVMVANCAAWIAEECSRFGLPLVALSAAQAQGSGRGVCDHAALGSWGGGHWDIGHGLSVAELVEIAAGGSPAVEEEEEVETMVLADAKSGGVWVAYPDGAVHGVDGAPYLGGTNNSTSGAGGHPCVGIYAYGDGYALVHEFGSGAPGSRDPRSYHFPRP